MRISAIVLFVGLATAWAQAQSAVSYAGANWSADGRWIAFTKMSIDQSTKPPKIDADVYVVQPDGKGLRRVTADGKNEFEPVFSRDGKWLYYGVVDPAAKTGDIFSSDLAGSSPKQLTAHVNHAAAPQLSPDGKWIAFNANLTADANDRHPQIYLMKSDGSGIKQLTNNGSLAFYDPVWSPDGKRLVYYVERGDNKDQIWSMKPDGSDQKLLTANIGHNFYPSWSADGKRILFTSNRDGKQQLYTMNADGSDVKTVGIEAFYARFSPDGKRIVYIGGKFPNMMLYVANTDGTGVTKLLN